MVAHKKSAPNSRRAIGSQSRAGKPTLSLLGVLLRTDLANFGGCLVS